MIKVEGGTFMVIASRSNERIAQQNVHHESPNSFCDNTKIHGHENFQKAKTTVEQRQRQR